MLKLNHFAIILLFIFGIFFSCSSLKKSKPAVLSKEAVIEVDSKAPLGYKPVYVSNVELFRIDTAINFQTRVLYKEVKNGKVRIYFNITDDKGKVYVHANHEKWDKVWCQVQEKSGAEILQIKKYQINHTTERDSVSNAFAFVLDHSGSMGDLRVLTIQNALSNLLTSSVKPEDAFSVIKYDNHITLEFPPTRDERVLMSKLNVNGIAEYGGGTAINDALGKAIDVLDSCIISNNKVAIIFTDGNDNSSKISKEEVILKAKLKGIIVFAIDFGRNADAEYMRELASQTGGCYYHIYSTNEFNMIFTDIYKRMKNAYILEYATTFFGLSQINLLFCNKSKKFEMHDFINNPLSKGNFINVNIKFDNNKSNISKIYSSEIDKLARIIKEDPNLKFQIHVHTDDVGDAKSNLSLSQKRADAIKNELIKKGADKLRITAKGFGESSPIADNKTKEGKALNRRIEFMVLD